MPRKKRASFTNRPQREAARQYMQIVRTNNDENEPVDLPRNDRHVTITNDKNLLAGTAELQHGDRHITTTNIAEVRTTAEPVRLRRRKNDFLGCAKQTDTAHFNEGIHLGLPQHNDGPPSITCQQYCALLFFLLW